MKCVLIQGVPRSGTTVMLDMFRHVVDEVYPETRMPSELSSRSCTWAWKFPWFCLETERIRDLAFGADVVWMLRNPRDVIASVWAYETATKTPLLTGPLSEFQNAEDLWCAYAEHLFGSKRAHENIVYFESLIRDPISVAHRIVGDAPTMLMQKISDCPVSDYPYGAVSTSTGRKVGRWRDDCPDLVLKPRTIELMKRCGYVDTP